MGENLYALFLDGVARIRAYADGGGFPAWCTHEALAALAGRDVSRAEWSALYDRALAEGALREDEFWRVIPGDWVLVPKGAPGWEEFVAEWYGGDDRGAYRGRWYRQEWTLTEYVVTAARTRMVEWVDHRITHGVPGEKFEFGYTSTVGYTKYDSGRPYSAGVPVTGGRYGAALDRVNNPRAAAFRLPGLAAPPKPDKGRGQNEPPPWRDRGGRK